jgi:hypothetical protein
VTILGLTSISAVAVVAVGAGLVAENRVSSSHSPLPAAVTVPLTPTEYRARANAICANANAQSTALGQATTSEQITSNTAAGLAIGRQKYPSLSALQPPPELAADQEQALGYLSQEIDLVANEVKQMEAGTDPVTAIDATGPAGLQLVRNEDAAWGTAGLASCSSGGF